MSDVAMRVEGLGKQYKIGRLQKRNDTLRDAIVGTLKRSNVERDSEQFIWALRDVSFEVKRGEVVGIIGRNGAGKSTLLKILSRITEPTEGAVDLYGRVASLLEVGTGFHPELTGRENVFLNGAILGMRRADIIRKFDEIVAFAEVEKFIDTPVKRFSSGMYVRLAFAVAAHMEPEILVVDEVLAVGDVKFQEKCMGKMSEVATEGRTILFVSHNLGAIQRLCPTSLLLDYGRLKGIAPSAQSVQDYLGLLRQDEAPALTTPAHDIALNVRVLNTAGEQTIVWTYGERLIVDVFVATGEVLSKPSVDIGFYTGSRTRLFSLRSDRLTVAPATLTGQWRVHFEIENPGITAPEMLFDVGLREGAGGYRKLVMNAGTLSADHGSFPELAEADWMLHTPCSVTWQPYAPQERDAVSLVS